MKRIITALLLSVILLPAAKAQLEKVIVEKYYISNDSDATDQTGGLLKSGSVTYRIYVDMKKGSKLTTLYGAKDHRLKIASDSTFFNNGDRGEIFGYNYLNSRYAENTNAVDTWLTLGQASKAISSSSGTYAYFGVPKKDDKSGSIIGGKNNDGGSNSVTTGLLSNNDPAAGIPLTTADGLDTMFKAYTFFTNENLRSTIFDDDNTGKEFASSTFTLQNTDGIEGINKDSNQVLIAQLTTKGALSFELNLQIKDAKGILYSYVAQNGADSSSANVFLSPYMTYPLACGCNDGNYLEYSAAYGCLEPSACKTLIVIGCMDPLSCNYNPKANVNDATQCCYPGHCNDRDIKLVCPALGEGVSLRLAADIYPNPAQDQLTIKYLFDSADAVNISVYDSYGKVMLNKTTGTVTEDMTEQLDVSNLKSGLYMFRISAGDKVFGKKFLKN